MDFGNKRTSCCFILLCIIGYHVLSSSIELVSILSTIMITALDIVLMSSVLILWLVICVKGQKHPKNFPPGPWGLPLLGHLPLLGIEPYKTAIDWIPKYGPIVGVNFGSFPCIIISDYKLIKEAGASQAFAGRPINLFTTERSGGSVEGIVFTEGPAWREQRNFAHRRLREIGGFGTRSMEATILDQLDQLVKRMRLNAGHPISTHSLFGISIVNALWTIIAGAPFDLDDPEVQRLTRILAEAFENVNVAAMLIIFVPILGIFPDWITRKRELEGMYKPIIEFLKPYLDKRFATHLQGREPGNFIDAFISEMKNTSDPNSSFSPSRGKRSLTTSLLDLFVAGVETSTTTLQWVCLILARYPEVQKRLAGEISNIVGQRHPSLADRKCMPYTEAVLHEVMRFRTLVPLSVSHSTMEPVHFHGFDIPKDTMVFFNVYAANTNREIWGDPEEFRPERWLGKDGNEFIRREGFLAFSTGKRVCLGEQLARDELFLFTVGLIQAFRIDSDPNSPPPTLEPKVGGTTTSPLPHRLVFVVRKDE